VRLPVPPLLLVTDRSQARLPLEDVIERACAGGSRWVSLREKDLPEPEQIAMFARLQPLAHRFGARAIIHGSAQSAKAAGADGVHLAAGSDPIAARALLGDDALIGLSVHRLAELEHVNRACVDYLLVGPAYETASKPGYGPALGPDGLAVITAATEIPVIAIGGIAAENASDLIGAGAAGIAIMGAVMRSPQPGREIGRLLNAVRKAPITAP
jgi:thiamine-phosphate pyrophosphorylase